MLNNVTLMGRLTANPELKTTKNGVSCTSFRIAVERSYAGKDGERKADFIDCFAFRNTAEFICKYFTKGSMIAVVGSIESRTYTTKEGKTRNILEVNVKETSFTGEKRDKKDNSETYSASPAPTPEEFEEMPIDDDLPF